jgi:prepilin-type N-terminal cleavage/methylation domain-containing protein
MRNRGFTLVEMMVVVAIIAILAAIAYPGYLDYTRKTVRTQAATYLMYLASEAQDYLIVHRAYPTTWAAFEAGFYDTQGYGDTSARQIVSKHYQWPPTIVAKNYGRDGWMAEPRFTFTLVPTSKLMQGDGHMCIEKSGLMQRYCETLNPILWNEE